MKKTRTKASESSLKEPSVRKVTSLLTRLTVEPEPAEQVHRYHKLLEPRPPSPEVVEEPKVAKFVHTYETEVLVGGKPVKPKERKHKHEKHTGQAVCEETPQAPKDGVHVSTAPKSLGGFRILQRDPSGGKAKEDVESAPVAIPAPAPMSAKEKLAKAKMLLKALTEESNKTASEPSSEESPRPIAVSPIEEIAVSPIAPAKASKPKGFLVPASVIKKKKAST